MLGSAFKIKDPVIEFTLSDSSPEITISGKMHDISPHFESCISIVRRESVDLRNQDVITTIRPVRTRDVSDSDLEPLYYDNLKKGAIEATSYISDETYDEILQSVIRNNSLILIEFPHHNDISREALLFGRPSLGCSENINITFRAK